MRIKLPTAKDIGFDIVEYIREVQPQSREEWIEKGYKRYREAFNAWTERIGVDWYEIDAIFYKIFYGTYYDQLDLLELKRLLETKQYNTYFTSYKTDSIFKVDIKAIKNNIVHNFQLKRSDKSYTKDELIEYLLKFNNLNKQYNYKNILALRKANRKGRNRGFLFYDLSTYKTFKL